MIEFLREVILDHEQKAINEAVILEREHGFDILIEILIDVKISEIDIIDIVKKHYNVTADYVLDRIKYINNVLKVIKNIEKYLVEEENKDILEAQTLIRLNNIEEKLEVNSELSKMKAKMIWKKLSDPSIKNIMDN